MSNPLTNWFDGVGKLIHDAFAKLFGANAASTLLAAEKQIFTSAIGSFALEVVTDLSTMDLSSEQKWEIAGEKIMAQAVVLGITLLKSQANLIIELAYDAVSKQQTTGIK